MLFDKTFWEYSRVNTLFKIVFYTQFVNDYLMRVYLFM